MNKKIGMLGVLGAVLVMAFMLMPTGTVNAVSGHSVKATLFEDNFDGQTEVDWDKWDAYSEDSFTISYDAMDVLFDITLIETNWNNWSMGVFTEEGFANQTLYVNNDVYLPQYFAGEFWTGLVDDEYVNDTITYEYAGIVGLFFDYGDPSAIFVWWVDSTNTLQFYQTAMTFSTEHWYETKIFYDGANRSATVNITDTVNDQSAEKTTTKLKKVVGDVKEFNFGYNLPPLFSKEGNDQINEPFFVSVALVDNVDIYTYNWIPATPPPVEVLPVPNFNQPLGLWVGIFGGIMTAVSIIFYADLSKYLSRIGYLNHASIAAIPAVVGLVIIGVGAAVYYGYLGSIPKPSWITW